MSKTGKTELPFEAAPKGVISDEAIAARSVSVPVSVVLQKRLIEGKFWTVPSWSLAAVLVGHELSTEVAGEPLIQEDQHKSADGESQEHFLWGGYAVTLYRDACERYWHSLIGEKPLVYVVLREDEADGSVEPAIVTIDYDEATAHCETDAEVLTAEIPGELYRMMERYVLHHYRPAEFKKRKRKNWSKDDSTDSSEEREEGKRLEPWDDERRFRRPGYHGPH